MKALLLTSSGALFVAMMACSPAATTSGTGGITGTGGAGTGGSSTGTGGTTPGSGGSGSGGTSAGTGGTGTGGATIGTGGTGTGTGGSGTGGRGTGGATTGTGGAGTGGAGGAAALPTITSTMFGAFDNAFMITPCGTPTTEGFDCPNPPVGGGACPTAQWPGNTAVEATGTTYTEVFTVTGGDPTKIYDATVHVRGQVEGRLYINGARNVTTAVDPSAAVSDLLYIGGGPGSTRVDYNVFSLGITVPTGGTAVPGAPLYYAFNGIDAAHEGQHHNYQIDETFTMKVKTGFVLTLTSHDSNCIAIQNCGPSGTAYGFASAALCQAAAAAGPQPAVPGVTLPTTFRGTTINPMQPFQTQFVNFRVTNIVAE